MTSDVAKNTKVPRCFVILVASGFEPRYLSLESDEDDGDTPTHPPTSANIDMALRFRLFTGNDARAELLKAVKKYPAHQFQLKVVEGQV